MKDPMYEPYVTISWCPADVASVTGWSDEKCMEALDSVARYLEDRSIELGWEVLDVLLANYEDSLDNDEEL